MKEIYFEVINHKTEKLVKAIWFLVKELLDNLSDEEIEKIPTAISPEQKRAAELYGICDIINHNDKYTYVYWTAGYLFKGETKLHMKDDN